MAMGALKNYAQTRAAANKVREINDLCSRMEGLAVEEVEEVLASEGDERNKAKNAAISTFNLMNKMRSYVDMRGNGGGWKEEDDGLAQAIAQATALVEEKRAKLLRVK